MPAAPGVEGIRVAATFSDLRLSLEGSGQLAWWNVAREARWRNVLAALDACGFEADDALPELLQELRKRGTRAFLEEFPSSGTPNARSALAEVFKALVEAGLCGEAPMYDDGLGGDSGEDNAGGSEGDSIREAARLLRVDSFNHMLEALDIIEAARRSRLHSESRAAQIDRLEAEGLRQYARHQAEAGRHGFAVDGYLGRAIQLDPRRAALYAQRARYRLQQHCPWLPQEGDFPSEGAKTEAAKALQDCLQALDLDDSLADVYDMALSVLFASGELKQAEELAARGEAAVRDTKRVAKLAKDRRYACDVLGLFDEAERLLAPNVRRPDKVETLVEALGAKLGDRLEPAVQRKLEALLKRCVLQKRCSGQRLPAAAAAFDGAWGGLFGNPGVSPGSWESEFEEPRPSPPPPPTSRPPPAASQHRAAFGGDGSSHGWGPCQEDDDPWQYPGFSPSSSSTRGVGGQGARSSSGGAPSTPGGPATAGSSGGASGGASGFSRPPPSGSAGRGDGRVTNVIPVPPVPEGSGELQDTILDLRRRLEGLQGPARQRLLRRLFLEWHPDKRREEAALATKVFQWLQSAKGAER